MKLFIGQDTVVFGAQDYDAPEQLAATDSGIVKWRRILADHAAAEAGDGDAVSQPADAPEPETTPA